MAWPALSLASSIFPFTISTCHLICFTHYKASSIATTCSKSKSAISFCKPWKTWIMGNDEEMVCSKESMLSWILQSYTQTNKEGQLMHVFKNFILNTNIQGLINAFLVHYYILQINKQNKFNVRMYISCSFLSFCKWPNNQKKCNVRILEYKFVPHINKHNKPVTMLGLTFLNPSLS
jgi:hypothetical protein